MTDTADIVPFGKYRDQPVERLLADRSYVEWLLAQPWFAERYRPVYNVIVGTGAEPQDTPEHNALQARFLDHNEALRLAVAYLHSEDRLRENLDARVAELTDRQRANLWVGDAYCYLDDLGFEVFGWDVTVSAVRAIPVRERVKPACECVCDPTRCSRTEWDRGACEFRPVPADGPVQTWSEHYYRNEQHRRTHCAEGCPATWNPDVVSGYTPYQRALVGSRGDASVTVELKPVIGDDYPSVLRAVLKRRDRYRITGAALVVAERAEFTSVTLDQVKRIYASQDVTFLTLAELPPAVSCECAACIASAEETGR